MKRRELESAMHHNALMAEIKMSEEHDAKMKQSDSLHQAQIERIQQEHLKYKDEMRINNSKDFDIARNSLIAEAKDHINIAVSKDNSSQDIIRQLQNFKKI